MRKKDKQKAESTAEGVVVAEQPDIGEVLAGAATEEETVAPEAEDKQEKKEEPEPFSDLKAVFIDAPQNGVEDALRSKLDWREIRAGIKTGRICTGVVTGIERVAEGTDVVVVNYKGYQVIIMPEDMISEAELDAMEGDRRLLRNRIGMMLGAEIDFMILAVKEDTKTVLASRRKALAKKAKLFFLEEGPRKIVPGRVAEARVVAVGFHSLRLEVFGVETTVGYVNLLWDWVPDLKGKYSVSDRIFVRVRTIYGSSPETLHITCEARSVQPNPDIENLDRCKAQSRYIGTVINLRSGSIAVRLSIGVNALAVGCECEEIPGRGEEVCFLVTAINENETVARGIITRIIRKNTQGQ